MPIPILATKLYTPPPRASIVPRARLIERLNEGLAKGRKLTLISAPAGFGKTTLVSEWIASSGRLGEPRVAWLSLEEGDSDLARFTSYLVAALQTIQVGMGVGLLAALQSPQPPQAESILTTLINEIAAVSDNFILVLDDYHTVDAKSIDDALAFLIEHQPPKMHLVIATREDPSLPLARYRARGQLTELRAADLRFTPAEAIEFLNRVMGLSLSAQDIAVLETRTEGWIAGLQLAALAIQGLSMQGQPDAAGFIQSFTGSHHFVLDYLVEEVLEQQSESVQTFLLRTSILDRLCGSLCDAVSHVAAVPGLETSGQETLEYLERANLFIVALDNVRQWYRYHHLFGNLLRQRLVQKCSNREIAELHVRASEWYEKNNLAFEAFQHAADANDVERAERLMESKGLPGKQRLPLHLRGTAIAVMDWLASLPAAVLDARPVLRVRSATLALLAGQTTGVEEKLQAAETAIQNLELDTGTRDLIGQIACARATLALTRYQPEAMLTQARRALEYLSPENLTYRFTANWALASASILQGDRATATRACLEGIAISQKTGDVFSIILATTNLARVQESENQLHQAAEAYRQALELSGEHPHPNAGEVYLGLARISYQWNDLDQAEQYGLQSLQLTRQFDPAIDRSILCEVFLAQLQLARGDVREAAARLAQAEQTAHQKNFLLRLPEIAAAQATLLLRQGSLATAGELARRFDLPISQARVLIAQGDLASALEILDRYRRRMEARGWVDERLRALALQAVTLHLKGENAVAEHALGEALALAEPGGFIRLFVDEGGPMAKLLTEAVAQGIRPGYIARLLVAFDAEAANERPTSSDERRTPSSPKSSSLVESLSPRELEVLRLIARGLSNQEIGEQLFLALDTVKGHNRRIFEKLQVQRRTEAIARARELGLL
jgi:LuxR family maltose regulon positive regulatory protein